MNNCCYTFQLWCIRFSTLLKCVVLAGVMLVVGCAAPRYPLRHPAIADIPTIDEKKANAAEYYIRARDYERRGLLKIAEREYENALQFDPDSKVLKKQLVRTYVASGKFTQALLLVKGSRKNEELTREDKRLVSSIYLKMNKIEKAARLLESISDKTAEESYSLAWIYESLGERKKALPLYMRYFIENSGERQLGFRIARMMLQSGHKDMADSFLVTLQNKTGANADLYLLRGTVALENRDTIKGMSFYDSSLAIDSLHEQALRTKAQVYINRAEFSSAIEYYNKLYSYFSYGDLYGRTLALLYYHDKQLKKAESLLQKLLVKSLNNAELHYYLGLVYAASDRRELAIIEFEKSLAIKDDNSEVWRELCQIYIQDKKMELAEEVVERYCEKYPKVPAAWRLNGFISIVQKKFVSAVTAYRKVTSLDSTDAFAWFELGSALERAQKVDSAVTAFKRVLSLKPDDAATLNYLGYMWAERGENLDTAQAYLLKALSKEPDNGAFLDSYAWILYQKKEYDSAFYYIERAVKEIEDDPVIHSHRGDIMAKLQRYSDAVRAYKMAIELHSEEDAILRQKIIDLEILLKNE